MKKCKDCGLFGCSRRGDGETECFYDIDLQRDKEAEEKSYWQSFREEAAKDILCAIINRENSFTRNGVVVVSHKDFIEMAVEDADALIAKLKEKEEK